jgi:methanogenic corrinoid protein MtbC1
LNNNVRILSLSYDSNIVASVHNDVTEIGKNLIQSLVTNSRCEQSFQFIDTLITSPYVR